MTGEGKLKRHIMELMEKCYDYFAYYTLKEVLPLIEEAKKEFPYQMNEKYKGHGEMYWEEYLNDLEEWWSKWVFK